MRWGLSPMTRPCHPPGRRGWEHRQSRGTRVRVPKPGTLSTHVHLLQAPTCPGREPGATSPKAAHLPHPPSHKGMRHSVERAPSAASLGLHLSGARYPPSSPLSRPLLSFPEHRVPRLPTGALTQVSDTQDRCTQGGNLPELPLPCLVS